MGERLHLFPEAYGIAQVAFGDVAEPDMLLAQNKGHASLAESIAITFED